MLIVDEPLAEKRKAGVAAREKMSVVWAGSHIVVSSLVPKGREVSS